MESTASHEDRSPRILVVEDEYPTAVTLGHMLELLACDVVIAGKIADALQLISAEALDGVLLDINIPGESIAPAVKALQALRIPVVFVSGFEHVAIAADYPAYPIICKPIKSTNVEQAVAYFRRTAIQK